MKKTLTILIFLILVIVAPLQAVDLWVSGKGNDLFPGTQEKPLLTLRKALRHAREIRRLNQTGAFDPIVIHLNGGLYRLEEPVLIRPEDSGTEKSPTIIEGVTGEEPVISGGIQVKNWQKLKNQVAGLPKAAVGNIWVADIPVAGGKQPEFRQLWVNGEKAHRASTLHDGQLNRVLSADQRNEILWIPKPNFPFNKNGKLELVIHQWWAIANLRVKNILISGDSAAVTFFQPESRIEFEHPWPAIFIDSEKNKNGNSAYWFANALELLDQPGEWFADQKAGKIYYWPGKDQDMLTAEAVIPRHENLVQITGISGYPVQNIRFKGITFSHTGWIRPSESGHVPLQAGMFLLDAYKLETPGTPDKITLENQAWVGRQPAAVEVRNAAGLVFERCKFNHLAATGLDLVSGTNHNLVQGCTFTDIGGTAIQAGFFGSAGFEAHLPYNPSDDQAICQDETIADNLISNATNEDWGCVGIGIGYARNILVIHNEVNDVNYSGISVGWGWTKTINCMKNNYIHGNLIHHFAKQMYDVGGIYTLSAQPNTEISENCIHHLEKAPYAHDPNHYQYIYLDEGSSYIRIKNNWTETDKFFSNTPGPGNEWTNNGPMVSDSIKVNAGIRKEFRHILPVQK